MAGMKDLANHIIAVGKRAGLEVTNLHVQKVMFFSFGFHVRDKGLDKLALDTYDAPFEKWKYGPVVESVYYSYNNYGRGDISSDYDGVYNPEYSSWDNRILKLLRMDIFHLVKVSHDLPSWSNFESEIMNRDYVESYTPEEIMRDFTV